MKYKPKIRPETKIKRVFNPIFSPNMARHENIQTILRNSEGHAIKFGTNENLHVLANIGVNNGKGIVTQDTKKPHCFFNIKSGASKKPRSFAKTSIKNEKIKTSVKNGKDETRDFRDGKEKINVGNGDKVKTSVNENRFNTIVKNSKDEVSNFSNSKYQAKTNVKKNKDKTTTIRNNKDKIRIHLCSSRLFILSFIFLTLAFSSISFAANPGHSASSISAGTFESGNFVFPNILQINQNLTVMHNVTLGTITSGTWQGSPISQIYLAGLSLPAANITAGTFGSGIFTFPSNLTITGDANVTGNLTLGLGKLWYNTSDNKYYYYNTTVWKELGTATATSPGLWVNGTPWTYLNTSYTQNVNISDILFINSSSGYVGIGTTTPLHELEVIGNANITGNLSIGSGKLWYNTSDNKYYYYNTTVWTEIGTTTSTNVSLWYGWNNTHWTPVLTTSTGILKLSTEEAQAENATNLLAGATGVDLTLTGNLAFNTITSGTWQGSPIAQAYLGGISLPAANITLGTFGSGAFTFPQNLTITNNLSVGSSTLFVDSTSGNVGIGTTSQSQKLHVDGGDIYVNASSPEVWFEESDQTSPAGKFTIGVNDDLFTLWARNDADTAWNKHLVVNRSLGNVGIGTTSPGSKLEVQGNVIFQGNFTNPGQPAFLAYNSATDADVTGDNTIVTVDFDTEVFDHGNNFASDTFTAPVTGIYLFTVAVWISGEDGTQDTFWIYATTSNRVYEGGSYVDSTQTSFNGNLALSFSFLADMDAGDTATVQTKVSGGSKTVDVVGDAAAARTWFSGYLVA